MRSRILKSMQDLMGSGVELLQGWGDVFSIGGSGDDMRSCVLYQSEFME